VGWYLLGLGSSPTLGGERSPFFPWGSLAKLQRRPLGEDAVGGDRQDEVERFALGTAQARNAQKLPA